MSAQLLVVGGHRQLSSTDIFIYAQLEQWLLDFMLTFRFLDVVHVVLDSTIVLNLSGCFLISNNN